MTLSFTLPTTPLRAAFSRLAALPAARAGAVLLEPFSVGNNALWLDRRTNSASCKLPCPVVATEGSGRVIVSFDRLNELVGRVPAQEISFRWDGAHLHWQTGPGSTGRFGAWPLDSLEPELPEPTATLGQLVPALLDFDPADFRDQVEVASSAMFTETGRDYMRGVLIRRVLNRLAICGMDGRRFHISFGAARTEPVQPQLDDTGPPTGKDDGLLLSREHLPALMKLVDTDRLLMTVGRNVLQVRSGDRVLRLALSSEAAPDLEQMAAVREPEILLPVDRAALLAAVKQALPLGRGDNKAITIFLGEDHIRVDADDGQLNTGSHTVALAEPPSRHGVAFRVAAPYAIDLLEACGDELCRLGWIRPGVLAFRNDSRYCCLQTLRDGALPKDQEP